MLSKANFLCEIGTEEIPAGYLPPAIHQCTKIVGELFEKERIDFSKLEVNATPRRMVISIEGLAPEQRSETEELKGPSVKAGFDGNGKPTKALEGFLRGNNLSLDNVERRETPKGEYIFVTRSLPSGKTEEKLPGVVSSIVQSLSFPKKMKWASRKMMFPRPIDYFAVQFNGKGIEIDIEGIPSVSKTRGHYVQHNDFYTIESIEAYESLLESKSVILDQEKRKKLIKEELLQAAAKAGGVLLEDEDLLETVTFLVESPHVVTCTFQEEFLSIPQIVLIAEMREHQKYFAVVDGKGNLTNTFLVVSNNPVTDYIRAGNERVIAARFNDARFFYQEDRKTRLETRVEGLKSVLFHRELGSVYDKIERMQKVAASFATAIGMDEETSGLIDRAVYLAKSDLDTALVIEFTSLQGKIGRIYALEDGEDPLVADAIENHYKPRSSEDEIPRDMVSIAVSLSEKIDNIFGSFSVGNIPKGSQDPYALRRQASAVITMFIENEINISLGELLSSAALLYKDGESLVPQILDFFKARVKTYFQDAGIRHDEIDASLSVDNSDFCELFRRAESVHRYREEDRFSELLLALKRMNNILSAFRKDNKDYTLNVSESLFESDDEKNLYSYFKSHESDIERMISESSYTDLFSFMTSGKSFIDAFFDNIMVMDERQNIRDNRLALLESILSNFSNLLDFTRISDK